MADEQVSVAALEALLASDALGAVLDVRERGELALRQIPGTSPLARGTLEYRAWSVVPTRRLPIVVLDDDGRRGALAAETLAAMGYREVRTLAGGLAAWEAAGVRPARAGACAARIRRARGRRPVRPPGDGRRPGRPPRARRAAHRHRRSVRGRVPARPRTRRLPHSRRAALLEAPPLLGSLGSPVVISCAGRTRGILGAQTLREAGDPNVQALLNGAMGWRLAGFELEMGPGRARPAPPPTRARGWPSARGGSSPRTGYVPLPGRLPPAARVRRAASRWTFGCPRSTRRRIPGAVLVPAGEIALHHENFLAVRRATLVVVADDAIRSVWAARLFSTSARPGLRTAGRAGGLGCGRRTPGARRGAAGLRARRGAPAGRRDSPAELETARGTDRRPPCWTCGPAGSTSWGTSLARAGGRVASWSW